LANEAEQELRRLDVEIRLLEQTADALEARINMINAVQTDSGYANATLETLEKEKSNAELLVPVGGNSYVRAKLENIDQVIVGIGSGVSVEKTLPEAKETIKKRIEELTTARNSFQNQFTQVAMKIDEDKKKLENILTQLRQGKARKDV
jgi:prefoldin alpha subunit